MAEDKFVKFFYEKFLKSPDVIKMSRGDVGSYALLLFTSIDQDHRGHLPDDDELLRKIARVSKTAWKDKKPLLMKKFVKGENGYYNKAMLKALKDQVAIIESSPDQSPTEQHELQKYVSRFPRISKLYPYQLSYKQCEMLTAQFSLGYIKEKLVKMENTFATKPSVFATVQDWCKKDLKK